MTYKLFLYSFFFIFVFFIGCAIISTTPDVLVRTEFSGDGIAVLDFTQQNTSMASNLGKLAADKLTDALFLERQFKVIDRAIVKEALVSIDIKNTELISIEDLQELGSMTNANFIILGRIQYYTSPEFLNTNSEKELYVSFRILSIPTGEVVGIGNHKCSFTDDLIDELNSAISYLVASI